MIRRLTEALPGPRYFQVVLLILVFIVAITLLVMFYDWLGDTLLDSGGTIG